jgi:hypothetical protein
MPTFEKDMAIPKLEEKALDQFGLNYTIITANRYINSYILALLFERRDIFQARDINYRGRNMIVSLRRQHNLS